MHSCVSGWPFTGDSGTKLGREAGVHKALHGCDEEGLVRAVEWARSSGLQNWEKGNFRRFGHSVCGVLLGRPEVTGTGRYLSGWEKRTCYI